MNNVWSTDDVTRATAAVAAENLLNEGVRNWKAGAFKGNIQKFKNFTELRSIQGTAPELADQIAHLATAGDAASFAQARQLFGKKLADETMADYSGYSQPHMYTSNLPGYLFGRFGSFSSAYRENIYRGWQNGQGVAGKALFVGRFVAINMAIFGVLEAAGISGKDFIPGYGGLFGGGPQFSTALAAFQSSSTSATGKTARQEFERAISPATLNETTGDVKPNFPGLLPGSLQLYYGKQMLQALDQGDYWKAFLAATTTPTLK
jgi:hypothetical protein